MKWEQEEWWRVTRVNSLHKRHFIDEKGIIHYAEFNFRRRLRTENRSSLPISLFSSIAVTRLRSPLSRSDRRGNDREFILMSNLFFSTWLIIELLVPCKNSHKEGGGKAIINMTSSLPDKQYCHRRRLQKLCRRPFRRHATKGVSNEKDEMKKEWRTDSPPMNPIGFGTGRSKRSNNGLKKIISKKTIMFTSGLHR